MVRGDNVTPKENEMSALFGAKGPLTNLTPLSGLGLRHDLMSKKQRDKNKEREKKLKDSGPGFSDTTRPKAPPKQKAATKSDRIRTPLGGPRG